MTRDRTLSPTLYDLGLSGPDGDAAAARVFADALLEPISKGVDRRDARLLLTVICLHLQCRSGPDATVADLIEILESCRVGRLPARLSDDPLSLTDYAISELGSLRSDPQSLAIEMALAAVKRLHALW